MLICNFTSSERDFNKLSYFFISRKKSCLVLKGATKLKLIINYFCVCHKTRQKYKFSFQNNLTLNQIKINTCNWKIKSTSHKQYLFVPVFSRNVKWIHPVQSMQVFLLCLNINDTYLQMLHLQKAFPLVHMLLVQLASLKFFCAIW